MLARGLVRCVLGSEMTDGEFDSFCKWSIAVGRGYVDFKSRMYVTRRIVMAVSESTGQTALICYSVDWVYL